jgi:hypothetical protein
MSQVEEERPVLVEEAPKSSRSLAARMNAKRKRREQQTTEIFPVPGWEEMLAVELKVVGSSTQDRIAEFHESVPNQSERLARTMADHIVHATVGFYEVDDEGERHELEPTFSWVTAAKGPHPKLSADTQNRAALRLLVDDNLKYLWAAWQKWMLSRGSQIDEELGRDFQATR